MDHFIQQELAGVVFLLVDRAVTPGGPGLFLGVAEDAIQDRTNSGIGEGFRELYIGADAKLEKGKANGTFLAKIFSSQIQGEKMATNRYCNHYRSESQICI